MSKQTPSTLYKSYVCRTGYRPNIDVVPSSLTMTKISRLFAGHDVAVTRLTREQNAVKDFVMNDLKGFNICIVDAVPGAGKTTVITSELQDKSNLVFLANTNAAVQNIKHSVIKNNSFKLNSITYSTIFQWINNTSYKDQLINIIPMMPDVVLRLYPAVNRIIVDEMQTVMPNDAKLLVLIAKCLNCPLIFIGDHRQDIFGNAQWIKKIVEATDRPANVHLRNLNGTFRFINNFAGMINTHFGTSIYSHLRDDLNEGTISMKNYNQDVDRLIERVSGVLDNSTCVILDELGSGSMSSHIGNELISNARNRGLNIYHIIASNFFKKDSVKFAETYNTLGYEFEKVIYITDRPDRMINKYVALTRAKQTAMLLTFNGTWVPKLATPLRNLEYKRIFSKYIPLPTVTRHMKHIENQLLLNTIMEVGEESASKYRSGEACNGGCKDFTVTDEASAALWCKQYNTKKPPLFDKWVKTETLRHADPIIWGGYVMCAVYDDKEHRIMYGTGDSDLNTIFCALLKGYKTAIVYDGSTERSYNISKINVFEFKWIMVELQFVNFNKCTGGVVVDTALDQANTVYEFSVINYEDPEKTVITRRGFQNWNTVNCSEYAVYKYLSVPEALTVSLYDSINDCRDILDILCAEGYFISPTNTIKLHELYSATIGIPKQEYINNATYKCQMLAEILEFFYSKRRPIEPTTAVIDQPVSADPVSVSTVQHVSAASSSPIPTFTDTD